MKKINILIAKLKQVTFKQYLFVFVTLIGLVLAVILLNNVNNVLGNSQQVYENNKVLKSLVLKQDSIIKVSRIQNDSLFKTATKFATDRTEILTIIREDSKIYKQLYDAKQKIPNTIHSLSFPALQGKVADYNY